MGVVETFLRDLCGLPRRAVGRGYLVGWGMIPLLTQRPPGCMLEVTPFLGEPAAASPSDAWAKAL